MIFRERSKRMLMYEKTKSKLREFSVKELNFPNFPLDSTDLVYTTIYALSNFCERRSIGNYDELSKSENADLKLIAEYFDYTVQAEEDPSYDSSLLLLGAITYFTIENFGNAKVLIDKINPAELEASIEISLYQILAILLSSSTKEISSSDYYENVFSPIVLSFHAHFTSGKDFQKIHDDYIVLRTKLKPSNDIFEVTFIDFFKPIITLAQEYSSWIALPRWSDVEVEEWFPYLILPNSIHLLWPAQKMIIQSGSLVSQNCVVPLPTGVGKTKSFELIIYKKLFIEKSQNVVVIAPLKALCNEITSNLKTVFMNFYNVKVTKFTEVYQDDTTFDNSKKNIIVATPEKFNFVLRHQPQFIDFIDLFIFDEAHLFDDPSRGVNYELLVAEVKRLSKSESQKILFSAILSNSSQISDWLFCENRVVENIQKIETSEKSIGYFSSRSQIHFYGSDYIDSESFFVPNIVQTLDLNINNNKFNTWKYPRNDSVPNKKVDLCIYFANKLVDNGAIATFVGRPSSIKKIMERMINLQKRRNVTENLFQQTSHSEMTKFMNLFELHYDETHIYTQGSSLGVLPHYGALSEGIRESVEFALKNNHYNAVISTSTLAEGVNIPIKYLLIYSLSQGSGKMQNRKIANLIGRTARSGIYTEGSIMLLDETLYENRDLNYRGRMNWKNNRDAFANKMIEECESRILTLVESFTPDFDKHILPSNSIMDWINAYYLQESNWEELVIAKFNEFSLDLDERPRQITKNYAEDVLQVIASLENYLSFIYVENREETDFEELVEKNFENTFAVYLADEEQGEWLNNILKNIAIKVREVINEGNKFFYSKSLYGLDVSKRIFELISSNEEKLTNINIDELISVVISWYYQLFEDILDFELKDYVILVDAWMSGQTVLEIQTIIAEKQFQKVEKILKKHISYDFSFFIGAVLDAVSEDNIYLTDRLTRIQKMIKYGANSSFSIEFCEKVANDRRIAKLIDNLLGNQEVESSTFNSVIKNYSNDIFRELENYPAYYSQKLTQYLSSNTN